MKTLVLNEPYHLSYEERAVPDCPKGYALLEVEAVSICGSDIHAFSGTQPLMVFPRVLGHELCASVVKMNGASESISIGDKVCVMPYIYCGECISCKQGNTNRCTTLKVLGVHIDGGICEYLSIPIVNLMKVPNDMDNKVVALIEPLSVGAHSVRRGNIGAGDNVLVVGAGPIGLSAAEMSKARGANVILADTSEIRRGFAHKKFGYNVLNPFDPEYIEQLKALAYGELPNKIIDSTGNQKSMAKDIDFLCYGGFIIYVGLQGGTLDVSDPEFHKKEATIFASRVALPEDFIYVLKCIMDGKIDPVKFVTHKSDFDHAKENLEAWIKKAPEVVKGIIEVKQ